MMIRPDVLVAIKAGEVDLAYRRWDRPRVRVGTRLRTRVGVLEVTSVEQVALSSIKADDARRSGAASVKEAAGAVVGQGGQAGLAGGVAVRRPRPARGAT